MPYSLGCPFSFSCKEKQNVPHFSSPSTDGEGFCALLSSCVVFCLFANSKSELLWKKLGTIEVEQESILFLLQAMYYLSLSLPFQEVRSETCPCLKEDLHLNVSFS